jgi:serine/threonine-protein kinase
MADLFGRYRLDDRLGQGGMGVVYRAWDTVLERVVALKMMIGEGDPDPSARERFFREARSAAQLTHKNIVTVYDLGEHQGQPYLAMEFLDGEDLQRRLARPEKASLWRKVDIAIEICHGMEFAHAHGVIHRDLKPGNIFITAGGAVKILDFGLARLMSSQLTQSNMLLGTINYMSPEQVRGERADQQSDLFSIGVVFYELFGRRRAFDGDSAASTLYKILQEYPEPLGRIDSELPRELIEIVDRALAKPRDERYQDVASMRRDLEVLQALAHQPGPSTPWPATDVTLPATPRSSLPPIAAASHSGAPPAVAQARTPLPASGAAAVPAPTPGSGAPPMTASAPGSAPPAPMVTGGSRTRGFWVGAGLGGLAIASLVVWMANRPAPAPQPSPRPGPSTPMTQTTTVPPSAPATPSPPASTVAEATPAAPAQSRPAADRKTSQKKDAAAPPQTALPPASRGKTTVPAVVATPAAPPAAVATPSPAAGQPTVTPPSPQPPAVLPAPASPVPVPQAAPASPQVVVSQPATPPTAAEAPSLSTERATELLQRYKASLEARNLEQLKRIWPSLTGPAEAAVRDEFQHAARITVEISDPRVSATASTGRIIFVRSYSVVTVDGQRLQSTSQATMDVRRSGDTWLVESIRFPPR